MLGLFQKRIEESLKEEKIKQQLIIQKQLEKQQSKNKIVPEAVIGVSKKKSAVLNEGMIPAVSGTGAFGGGSGYQQVNKKSEFEGHSESIEDKKERLFKWNAYQTVKFTQDLVKDILTQNFNVLRFLNLFESFDTTIMGWGSNEAYHFGLYLRRNIQTFYQIKAIDHIDLKVKQEHILSQIMNFRTLQNSANDQQSTSVEETLLRKRAEEHETLKNLMRLWQQTLNQDPQS